MTQPWIDVMVNSVASGIVAVVVAWIFFHLSGRHLRREAAELRRLNKLLLLGMGHAGWIKLNFDKDRNIIGFEQTISGAGGIKSGEAFGTPSLRQSEPKGGGR